jgi:formylglycine-generating enzyme required for sulfatase activity
MAAACAAVLFVVSTATAQAPLAWRLKENDRVYVAFQVKRQDRGTLQGRAIDGDENNTQVYRFKVLSRTPDGGLVLEVVLESLRCSKPDSPLIRQSQLLQSEALRATLDANMNVVKIDGAADIARRNVAVESPTPSMLTFGQRLLEDEVRTMINEAFPTLPNRPTPKGDQWQQTTSVAQFGIGLLVLKKTFTDEGDELLDGRPVRKVTMRGDMTVGPPDWNEADLPVQSRHFEMKGQEHVGTLYFDVSTGRLVQCERRNRLQGEYTSTLPQGKTLEGNGEQITTATIRVYDRNPLVTPRTKVGPPSNATLPPSGVNTIGMHLVGIPAGKFEMGSPDDEEGRLSNETLREVQITQAFYMGAHEVTVGQFRQFVEATGYKSTVEATGLGANGWNADKKEVEHGTQYNWKNPGFPQTDNHPVVLVSWNDAKAFCDWLSQKEGRVYRLPTEAEWEYACRAGTNTRYYSGDEPESLATYGNISDQSALKLFPWWAALSVSDGNVFPTAVGSYKPNAWGLYDMHGNALEWCADWYWEYSKNDVIDPKGPNISSKKVTRGGSWVDFPMQCRCASRYPFAPNEATFSLGFRVVLENPKR